MATSPDYMADFDRLFGEDGYRSYLNSLQQQYTGTAAPTAQDEQSTQAAPQRDLNTLEGMQAYAKEMGWADPGAFSADMLVDPDAKAATRHSEGGDWAPPTYTQFKDEYAAARGMSGDYASGNQVEVRYGGGPKTQVEGTGTFWDNEAVYQDSIPADQKSGYRLKGGQVKDSKFPTAVKYLYDNDGKYTGYELDTKTPWYVDAAPLISMGLMAAGVGGAFSGLGSAANTQLGLGLGTTGQAALGGGIVGGGVSALTGQNPIKGAAIGAIGAGVGAYNPAKNLIGIQTPFVGNAVNGALSAGAQAAVSGGDVGEAMATGGIRAGLNTFKRNK